MQNSWFVFCGQLRNMRGECRRALFIVTACLVVSTAWPIFAALILRLAVKARRLPLFIIRCLQLKQGLACLFCFLIWAV